MPGRGYPSGGCLHRNSKIDCGNPQLSLVPQVGKRKPKLPNKLTQLGHREPDDRVRVAINRFNETCTLCINGEGSGHLQRFTCRDIRINFVLGDVTLQTGQPPRLPRRRCASLLHRHSAQANDRSAEHPSYPADAAIYPALPPGVCGFPKTSPSTANIESPPSTKPVTFERPHASSAFASANIWTIAEGSTTPATLASPMRASSSTSCGSRAGWIPTLSSVSFLAGDNEARYSFTTVVCELDAAVDGVRDGAHRTDGESRRGQKVFGQQAGGFLRPAVGSLLSMLQPVPRET